MGCGKEVEQPYPSSWPPLDVPERFLFGQSCPNLTGQYTVASGPLFSLIGKKVAAGYGGHIVWKYAEAQAATEKSMVFKLTAMERYAPVVFASIILQEGKDYACKKGWMIFPLNGAISDLTAESSFMAAGMDQAGNLVIKTTIRREKEIDGIGVWCGDGCKEISLPFTIKTHSSFTKWQRWEKAAGIPDSLPLSEYPRPAWRR